MHAFSDIAAITIVFQHSFDKILIAEELVVSVICVLWQWGIHYCK